VRGFTGVRGLAGVRGCAGVDFAAAGVAGPASAVAGFVVVGFAGADFAGAAFAAADFAWDAFAGAAFAAPDFGVAGFLGAGFFTAGSAGVVPAAAGLSATGFRAAGFPAAGFPAAGFPAAGFRAAGFRAAGFRAGTAGASGAALEETEVLGDVPAGVAVEGAIFESLSSAEFVDSAEASIDCPTGNASCIFRSGTSWGESGSGVTATTYQLRTVYSKQGPTSAARTCQNPVCRITIPQQDRRR
jgi:hypothetical protein